MYFHLFLLFYATCVFATPAGAPPQESPKVPLVISSDDIAETQSSDYRFDFNKPISLEEEWQDTPSRLNVSIVAVVGDVVITSADVAARAMLLTEGRYPHLSAEAQKALKLSAMEALIDEKVILQIAARTGSVISKDEITSVVEQMENSPEYGPGHFTNLTEKCDVPMEHVHNMLRGDILWRSIASKELAALQKRKAVTLYNAQDDQILLEEIAVSKIGSPDGLAQAVSQALAEGVPFANLAGRISSVPSATQNGRVGWIPDSILQDDIRTLVAKLPLGGTTEVIETATHYCIYHVIGKRSSEEAAKAQWLYNVTELSVPLQGTSEQKTALIQRLNVMKLPCQSSHDLRQMSHQIDNATLTVHEQEALDSFPEALRNSVQNLQEHTLSPVVAHDNALHVFMLDSKNESDQTADSTRSLIDASSILRQKKAFLRGHIYIEMVESF
ncbi:MAG: peptidylprolyl isomerase [Alphaproteobacteria bacterium]|nr:peptidylprolyl isomerase [Alphaproteobacteria bacterium]